MYFKTNLSKIVLLTVLLVSSCQIENTYLQLTEKLDNNDSFKTNPVVSFELVKTTTLSSCTQCHSGNNEPTIVTDSDIKEHILLIQNEINNDSMPPSNPLTDCQKAIINKWIELGLPDKTDLKTASLSACAKPQPPEYDNTPISLLPLNYQNAYTKILQKKCVSCHRENGSEAWLKFYPYSEIQKQSKFWKIPGASSKMVRLMGKGEMPPENSGIPPATDDEITFIINWIDAGMPE